MGKSDVGHLARAVGAADGLFAVAGPERTRRALTPFSRREKTATMRAVKDPRLGRATVRFESTRCTVNARSTEFAETMKAYPEIETVVLNPGEHVELAL